MRTGRNRALTIFLVGGAIFTALAWYGFDAALIPAALAGFGVMGVIALLDHVMPRGNVWAHAFMALFAGSLIGAAIWWVFPIDLPWYVLSLPCAVLALAEAMLERFATASRRAEK